MFKIAVSFSGGVSGNKKAIAIPFAEKQSPS